MAWTNEFRDEMRQRQLARFRYSVIAVLVVDFFLVLMLGYIWLNNLILSYIILILFSLTTLLIPYAFVFKYLLRYDFMVKPIALITLCLDMIGAPFIVLPLRCAN